MINRMAPAFTVIIIIAAVVATMVSSGCSPDNLDVAAQPVLISIEINPPAPSMAPGTTLQFQARGIFSTDTRNLTQDVIWTSSDTTVVTVNEAGLATASSVISSGSVTITASSADIAGSAVVAVSPLSEITVTPADPTIASGTTLQFTAAGTLQNGAIQDITDVVSWSSSNAGVATVTSTGLASAVSDVTGSSTISASFGTSSGSTLLTSAAVTSISVSPEAPSLVTGTTQQLTATGTLSNGVTQNLTSVAAWAATPAGVVSVTSTGLVTALARGSAVVTASFSGASGSATIQVTDPVLTSISITPDSATLAVDEEQQFTAMGIFSNGAEQDVTADVTWTSTNDSVATVSNSAGTEGLAASVAPGTATITARLSDITSNIATVTVTPVTPTLTSITVTPSNPTLVSGSNTLIQFSATGVLSDGTTVNLTDSVIWASSNPGVATINNAPFFTGQATATGGIGSTTISATDGNVTGSTTLTVNPFLGRS